MRVLVTGGVGYFGSHLCKALSEAGHLPVTFDDLSTGHRWAVDWGPVVIGHLADGDFVKQTLLDFEIEAVMHFATDEYVGASVSDPPRQRQDLWNGIALLDALVEVGVHSLVFSSSHTVYGPHPQGGPNLKFGRALRWYGQTQGLRTVSLRFLNDAGAHDSVRDYAQVTDLALAHVQALDHLAGGGDSLEIYISTGRGYSVREVMAVAAKVAHRPSARRVE
jgi:UDP-arabinose 4-epimerase